VAIFVPNALGIILYFILREPILGACTRCGTLAKAEYAFCPKCGEARGPACPRCRKAVEQGWTVCAYCGARLG
jgi:RNA polymerase subunit RPABC4/transcription elongation factor Spt4